MGVGKERVQRRSLWHEQGQKVEEGLASVGHRFKGEKSCSATLPPKHPASRVRERKRDWPPHHPTHRMNCL